MSTLRHQSPPFRGRQTRRGPAPQDRGVEVLMPSPPPEALRCYRQRLRQLVWPLGPGRDLRAPAQQQQLPAPHPLPSDPPPILRTTHPTPSHPTNQRPAPERQRRRYLSDASLRHSPDEARNQFCSLEPSAQQSAGGSDSKLCYRKNGLKDVFRLGSGLAAVEH